MLSTTGNGSNAHSIPRRPARRARWAAVVAFMLSSVLVGALAAPAQADPGPSSVTVDAFWNGNDASRRGAQPSVGVFLVPELGEWNPDGSGTWYDGSSGLRRATLTYQWLLDGIEIPAATAFTYVPGPADVTKQVSVRVTAVIDGTPYVLTSEPVTVAPGCFCKELQVDVEYTSPVTGNPQVGTRAFVGWWQSGYANTGKLVNWYQPYETVTSDAVGFKGYPALQWLRNGTPIAGATAQEYTLQVADVGKTITASYVFSAPGYATQAATATEYYVVDPGTLTRGALAVTGTAKVGLKLTAAPGTWKPAPVALTYQWLRAGKAIAGATKSTYTLTAADLGKAIAVKVTGTKTGYTSASATSRATAAVKAGTITVTARSRVTGTAKVGRKLAAVKPKVSVSGVTYTFRWLRNGKAISRATKATYKLTSADKGKKISVRVTVKKPAYTTVSSTSATTKKVAK